MSEDRGPLVNTRFRMPARVAAVFIGYFIYRWVDDPRLFPSVFVGLGAVLVMWAVIDELTLVKRQRSSLMQVGSAILGLVLILLGAYLAFG